MTISQRHVKRGNSIARGFYITSIFVDHFDTQKRQNVSVLFQLPGFILDPVCFTIIILWLTEITRSFSSLFLSCVIITLVMNTSAAFGEDSDVSVHSQHLCILYNMRQSILMIAFLFAGMMMSLLCRKLDVAISYVYPIEIILMTCSGVYIKLS